MGLTCWRRGNHEDGVRIAAQKQRRYQINAISGINDWLWKLEAIAARKKGAQEKAPPLE